MSNIPKLRFPEFKGEWEEKKLSDIASFSKGKGYTKNDLVKNGTPIVLYGRMYTKYEAVISDIDTFVNLQVGSIISKGGEIIVPASGETAEEISRASVVKNKGIILGGDLNILSLQKDKYNPEFFALTISSGTSQKRLSKLAQGKSVVHLHNEDLSGLQIKVSSLAEQQKIADFLSNVDSIITAETKILNTLQKKKKALMQKLFTRQLRFKSADGTDFPEWEEKKLGDVCNVLSGKRVPKGNKLTSVNTGLKYITVSDMGDKFVSNKDIKYITQEIETKIKKYKVITGDIIISVAGTLGKVNIITEEFNNANLTENCDKLTEFKGCITEYLFYYLQSDKFLDEINRIKTSSAQPKLALDRLRIFVIPIPIIKEQQKIAACLSSLDSLIQTQQKVVTTWQQRKKALLQQMFI